MGADNNLPEANNIMTTKSGLIPTNINEAMQLSEILAKSEIVPKEFIGKPSNIFVAVNWGIEIGLSPMQSLQSIAVINGRPSIWGDSALALVRGSGKLEYIKETQTDQEATCIVKRVGEQEVKVTFSMKDAIQAGLVNRSAVWKAYPKRMMQMRARSFALRDTFTDVLKGIGIAEEVEDTVETEVLTPAPETKPAPKEDTETTTVNLKEKPATEPEPEAMDAEIEEVADAVVTVQDIMDYYMELNSVEQAKVTAVMSSKPDWRQYDSEALGTLLEELKGL